MTYPSRLERLTTAEPSAIVYVDGGSIAVSIGILLVGLVVLAKFSPSTLIPGALLLLGVYAFIEALFHRNLESLIRSVVVALAVLATVVLVIHLFVPLLPLLIVLVGIFILVENVRELLA